MKDQNVRTVTDKDEIISSEGYSPVITEAGISSTSGVELSEADLALHAKLETVMAKFGSENDVEVSVGKMSKNGKTIIGFTQSIEGLPEGITSKQAQNFYATKVKIKDENDVVIESKTLNELGITLGEKITMMKAAVPKSRKKILCSARVVSGMPNGKSNKISVLKDGLDKPTPMTVEEFLDLRENPLNSDDLMVANDDARWGERPLKENGEVVIDEETNEPVMERVLIRKGN